MSDDDLTAEAGSKPPLRGFAHSERCAQMAERAAAAEAALDEATRGNGPYIQTLRAQRDAAEADAERLAAALVQAAGVAHRSQHDHNTPQDKCYMGDHPGSGTRCGEWTAALAAHEARVKP